MTLDEFLRNEAEAGGITAEQFAAVVGLTGATLSRIRHGANTTREVMQRIIAASNGKVTADGLVQPHAVSRAAEPEAA